MITLQPEPERAHRKIFFAGAGVVAVALCTGAIWAASRIQPPESMVRPRPRMTLVEVERPQAPPTPPAAEPPEPTEPAPRPPPAPPPERQRRPRPKVAKAPEPTPEPSPEPAPEPARGEPPPLIAGLTLSSTVTGGSGPAFGIGNTAMGRPDRVASDPSQVHPRAACSEGESPPVRRNAKLRKKIMPAYPLAAREKGIEGAIVLVLAIDEDGKVTDVKVIKGLGHGLDEAAVAAALGTEWSPATLDGRPIPTTRRYNVLFKLEG